MIIAVTGHRPEKLSYGLMSGYIEDNPLRCWIREQLRAALSKHHPLYGITGMALGVDCDFARVCLNLGIPYVAAVPFAGQEHRWRPEAQVQYHELLGRAREVVIVNEGGYARWKMHARNQWMADRCNLLIAVWDGSVGGTGHCVGYAQRIGRPIHFIDPGDFHAGTAQSPSVD